MIDRPTDDDTFAGRVEVRRWLSAGRAFSRPINFTHPDVLTRLWRRIRPIQESPWLGKNTLGG